jgi:hypothetical protein
MLGTTPSLGPDKDIYSSIPSHCRFRIGRRVQQEYKDYDLSGEDMSDELIPHLWFGVFHLWLMKGPDTAS